MVPNTFISLPLTNSLTSLLKNDWIILLLISIILFFIINFIGTILIFLCIITPLLFSLIIYKTGVEYTKTNYIQLHNNTTCIIIALVLFLVLFILVSITILYYYEGLLNVHSHLLSLNSIYSCDDGLRNPLQDQYNVLTRQEAGLRIAWEATNHRLKYGRWCTLGEIGEYGNGIYSREFRHVLPHVKRWLHTRSFSIGSDISRIVCTQAFGREIVLRP
jgi:hypothetical protein